MLKWGKLEEGILLQRVNRFLALVEVAGSPKPAFIANSGRLTELMIPGAIVFLSPAARPRGRTQLDLKLVDQAGVLVSVDTRTPNDLLHHELLDGCLAEFPGRFFIRREVTYGNSRFDFALVSPDDHCLVEAKSVTLVRNATALFPDAPSQRAAKHMATLQSAAASGYRAAVVFLVQREDAGSFSPHDAMDPDFGRALREAMSHGVEAYAYVCKVNLEGIKIAGTVPLLL